MNYIGNINNFISIYLNNFILSYHLKNIIGFLADGPIFFIPIFLVGYWLYYTFKSKGTNYLKNDLLNISYSIVLAMIGNSILKIFIIEKRPETLITPILSHVPDNSFPSDHATVSFAFLTGLYLFGFKKTFWIFLPFVIFMNIARIAGGLHWFFDIVVGMILGILGAIIIYKLRYSKIIMKLNNIILKIASFIKL